MLGRTASPISTRWARANDKWARLSAFDLLANDGKDYRQQGLSLRKANLTRLLERRVDSIFIAEYEQGDMGDVLFRVASNMGLEGIVSKRLDRAYGGGQYKHGVKVKNPAHPAYIRVMDRIVRSRR
jgi:ATP-dependent DNA ligase